MALKRRDVILAGIASFIAWGYAIEWVPTLRWAGYAFVVGLILPVLALIALLVLTSKGAQYGERSSIRRPKGAAFLSATAWKHETAALRARQTYERKPLYPESFIISSALDELLELIERDFVSSWYSNISKNPVFTNEVDKTIRMALGALRDRLLELDVTEIMTTRFVPIMTAHFRDFYEAERSIRGKHLNRSVTESEELDLAIAGKYKDGKLHPAASLAYADTKLVQQEYLRKLTKDLLPKLLPESVLASRAVGVIIKELVSCAVLSPVMQLLSDPDTWNQVMEAYVCKVKPERVLVHADTTRDDPCCKTAQQSKNYELLWMSMPHQHQEPSVPPHFLDWHRGTMNGDLRDSYELSGKSTTSQTLDAFEVKYLVNSRETPYKKILIRYIFAV
jgi:sorting nexin-25